MHIYMVCPSQPQRFTKFCRVVSEDLHWQEKQDWRTDKLTDWLTDGLVKKLYSPQLVAWGIMKDMLWTSVFAVSYEEPLSSLVASYDKQRVRATSPNYTFFRSQCMAKQFDSRSQNKAGEPKQENYLCWVNLWYVLEHRFGYWANNFLKIFWMLNLKLLRNIILTPRQFDLYELKTHLYPHCVPTKGLSRQV